MADIQSGVIELLFFILFFLSMLQSTVASAVGLMQVLARFRPVAIAVALDVVFEDAAFSVLVVATAAPVLFGGHG